ncbi:MAG: superoxide dismutase [Bacteroidales bacterium]|nr:superoxide dismutase [Bacteroidales bacterium]
MAFELPRLNYALDALEPVIDRRTMEFHYGKHHQVYVNKLNELIKGSPFVNSSLEEIIKEAEGGIYNNGAQVWNHTFYFQSFKPKGGGKPEGELASVINNTFKSFDKFKEQFSNAAITLFGSGWTWLVKNDSGDLQILQESNAGNPLRNGLIPILTCDVWEHAYYLNYQNRRPDYVKSFWDILDWETISRRY